MKVLIVDDTPDLIKLFKFFFEKKGLEVITADDGEKALSVFDDTIDVVLTDVMMPKKNGFELLNDLKKLKPELPVYLMSVARVPDYKNKARELGAKGFFGEKEWANIYQVISELREYF